MGFKISIIEDDVDLASLTKNYLEKYGFEVSLCDDFKNIDMFIKNISPDIILIDINIPYYDGFYWCSEIRKTSLSPIIFISARTEDYDQIRAIMSGGDDYLTKPYSFDLLLAKINAQLRRVYGEYSSGESEHKCGDCELNRNRFILKCGKHQTDLSKNEAILLELLFEAFPNVVTREQILSEIWDSDSFVEENTVNVTVSRARKKILEIGSKMSVRTVRGIGYKMEYDDE